MLLDDRQDKNRIPLESQRGREALWWFRKRVLVVWGILLMIAAIYGVIQRSCGYG
jgi:hypothetical protein